MLALPPLPCGVVTVYTCAVSITVLGLWTCVHPLPSFLPPCKIRLLKGDTDGASTRLACCLIWHHGHHKLGQLWTVPAASVLLVLQGTQQPYGHQCLHNTGQTVYTCEKLGGILTRLNSFHEVLIRALAHSRAVDNN